ncbi:hypothetical protein D3C87_1312680 [compost metagenome]
MFYEDEALPDFVHNFGETKSKLHNIPNFAFEIAAERPPCRVISKVPCEFLLNQEITQKMETPVVYFYSDKAQPVRFDVWFPGGVISQSYPAPLVSLPKAVPGVELKNGFARYDLNILKDSNLTPPAVSPQDIYSHARNTKADLVQSGSEVEKFIFYRGLGEFKTKLKTTSQAGQLQLRNVGSDTIPAAFVIYTDGAQRGALIPLGALAVGKTANIEAQAIAQLKATNESQAVFLKQARTQLLNALTAAGLYHDEAVSMVDTWEHGYFKTPGLRVLYVLGNHEVESILPIQVTPQPEELHRVFVGRIEVLLDSQEEQILNEVLHKGRQYDVARLGRMAHPILSRIREVAKTKGLLSEDLSATIDALIAQIR